MTHEDAVVVQTDWQEDLCPRCGNCSQVFPPTGERICYTCEEQQRIDGPQPLFREVPDADPFPVEALHDVLGGAARAIQDKTQAPDAICGQSVLAAASLVVQGHVDVELPTRAVRPSSLFLVTIGESGERKTSADELALAPIRDRERQLAEEYRTERSDYENGLAAWEKQRADDLRRSKTIDAKRSALANLGPKPTPPPVPMLTCPEPTFEGLCRLFFEGHPSLGIFSSEGGQFVGGFGMSADHRLKTAAGFSSFWDGESVRRVRAGDGAHVLDGKRLSVHLLLQPAVSSHLLADEELRDQGLLTRLLVAAPSSTIGKRPWRETTQETETALTVYGDRLSLILGTALPVEDGSHILRPRVLRLRPRARSLWIKFADDVEGELGELGQHGDIRGFANKLAEHAARLAAVVALVEDPTAGEIEAEDLARGIQLAQFYASEARRLFDLEHTDAELVLAQRLLSWIHGTWIEDVIALADIYQRAPSRKLRTRKDAMRIVEILEDHNWLERLPPGTEVAGVKKRDSWRIVRRV